MAQPLQGEDGFSDSEIDKNTHVLQYPIVTSRGGGTKWNQKK